VKKGTNGGALKEDKINEGQGGIELIPVPLCGGMGGHQEKVLGGICTAGPRIKKPANKIECLEGRELSHEQ